MPKRDETPGSAWLRLQVAIEAARARRPIADTLSQFRFTEQIEQVDQADEDAESLVDVALADFLADLRR